MNKLLLILLSFISILIKAQNLVPNYSFENYISCPNTGEQLELSVPWFNPAKATPDYYNKCNTSIVGVPSNANGIQYARTGVAYAGIITYFQSTGGTQGAREYIAVRLTEELKTGGSYCVEFYVSLADSSKFATGNIGMYFSKDSIKGDDFLNLPYIPQAENTQGILKDKESWVPVSAIYAAQGGEKYITIGNFYNDANTELLALVAVAPTDFAYAYYYIDDVSVVEINESTAEAGTDTSICEGKNVTIGSPAQPNYIYSWQPAEGLSDATAAQPVAAPTQTTTYYLTVTDTAYAAVCRGSKTDSLTIAVIADCDTIVPTTIEIPNIFTPNGDNVNDVFTVKVSGIVSFNAIIYNRWGQEITDFSTSLEMTGALDVWNGRTTAGTESPEGVYYYVIKYKGIEGIEETRTGFLHLMR